MFWSRNLPNISTAWAEQDPVVVYSKWYIKRKKKHSFSVFNTTVTHSVLHKRGKTCNQSEAFCNTDDNSTPPDQAVRAGEHTDGGRANNPTTHSINTSRRWGPPPKQLLLPLKNYNFANKWAGNKTHAQNSLSCLHNTCKPKWYRNPHLRTA